MLIAIMIANIIRLIAGEIFHLEPCSNVNAIADGARHWAIFSMHLVRSFRGFPLLWFKLQVVSDVDAPDNQNLVFGFNLTQRL